MKRRLLIALVLLAGVVGVGVFLRAQNDPRAREIRRIQNRLSSLAREASFTDKEAGFQRLTYPSRLSAFFANPAQLQFAIGERTLDGTYNRRELEEGAARLRSAARGLQVDFLDIVVQLEGSSGKATNATTHLTSKIYFTGDSDYWVQEFRLNLVKKQNEWLIERFVTLRTMEQ